MTEIDPIILRLTVDGAARYKSDLQGVERVGTKSFAAQERAVISLERQIRASSGQISGYLRGMAGVLAGAFSAGQVIQMADSYTRFQNALKVAGLEGQALADTQEELFQVAQRNGVQLEAVATLYSRAAQNQKELGASSEDLVNLTRAVAASLKISGTSASEASGSLLQLGQALGSPRVQAEEFNSLLDTMQPLLREAAKYIDGTGGSLSGLTRKIKDTKGEGVSNVELFRAITKALAELEKTADGTTLTIGAAFTNLSNSLTKYIGEADRANGVTATITMAIQKLSENIDLVADALSVIAVVAFGRFVGGAMAGGRALQVVSAYASVATTSLAGMALAARAAGVALVTALGGPIGLAVAALTAGIVYLATRTTQLERAQEAQARGTEAGRKATEALRDATDKLSTATGKAREEALANAKAKREEALQSLAVARAAIQEAKVKLAAAKAVYLSERAAGRAAPAPGQMGIGGGMNPAVGAAANNLEGAVNDTGEAVAKFNAILNGIRKADAAIGGGPPAIGGTGDSKPKKTPKGRTSSGPSPEEIEARFLDELGRSNAGLLAARAQLTGAAQARYKAEIAALDEELAAYRRQVALDENLSEPQRARLIAAREAEMQERRAIAQQDLYRGEQEQAFDLFRAENEARQELLAGVLEGVEGASDRRALQLRMLQLQRELEEAQLDLIIATKDSASAEHSNAVARKGQLDAIYGQRQQAVHRGTEGPLETYARGLNRTDGQLRDQAESLVVDKLQSVEDGITDALTEKLGTKDPLIAGLIRLLIQEVLMKPIANALNQAQAAGGGGGGFFSSLVSAAGAIFGRASGGYVAPGQTVRVNEQAGGVELLKMGSQGGKVIPLGQTRAQRHAGAVQKVFNINISADNSVTPAGFAQGLAQQILAEAARMDARTSKATRRASIGDQSYFQDTGNVR